ncbi:MAG TPA: ferrous iron transporter B [Fimbriimonadales bacterium]|nr:ferrous iron transporter B [Fimbriimonadales bacterium]
MSALPNSSAPTIVRYPESVESVIQRIEACLRAGDYPFTKRSVAILALYNDTEILESIERQEGSETLAKIRKWVEESNATGVPPSYLVVEARQNTATEIAKETITKTSASRNRVSEYLGRLCTHPFWGFPILLLVLYFGLYQFVGVFGAGTLVGWVEEDIFGKVVNPWVISLFERFNAPQWLNELFVGEYGVWTLGVTYAVALILPIIATFFIAFSILEDSGYLPRLSLLVDRIFKRIGLNGRGVIPIVLGFGCDTMATIVTRILESKRERVIATFLLSLCIPCSAQLAVVAGLLATQKVIVIGPGISIPTLLVIWGLIMTMVFLLSGFLAAKITPGRTAPFYMELPPIRLPSFANVFAKTFARMQWYFLEVFPLFIVASVVIWMGQMPFGWALLLAWIGFAIVKRWGWFGRLLGSGYGFFIGLAISAFSHGYTPFQAAITALRPLVNVLLLPIESAEVFLFGFFRRDYGAAGLDKLVSEHSLTPPQMLVIAVTITLFLPCIAQFLVVRKERGLGMAVGMLAFTLFFATLVGALLARILMTTGWLA